MSYNISTMKNSLGQNFLQNEEVIKEFINFCNVKANDNILEIGPGKGALSFEILRYTNQLTAIEIDEALVKELQNYHTNIKVFKSDILHTEIEKFIKTYKITKIISAVPYYITSPIIHKLLEASCAPLSEIYLITQKEFAAKLVGKKKRSYFTNLIESYGEIVEGNTINKNNFSPIPKVDSMYFGIELNKYPQTKEDFKKWSKFLHKVYNQPRKKIKSTFDIETLKKANIDQNNRPEELKLVQIQKLYELEIKNRETTSSSK